MAYNHGVRVLEQDTSLTTPIEGTAGLQVVFGTAPVNLADDPYAATNVPVIAYSYAEAVSQLGYSSDFKNYTLCQSISANFQVFSVAPVIFVNVLDPKKHIKANDDATVEVNAAYLQATVETAGILMDTVKVMAGETELVEDTDYVMSFDDDGYLVITLTSDGAGASATELTVSSTSIDPTAVGYADIVGGYDSSTGAETGLELIRQVYPKFGMTPGLILAPGWSQYPTVAAAMNAKRTEINGYFRAEAILDMDCSASGATKYTDCNEWKNNNGYTYEGCVLLWPQVIIGDAQYAYSAIYGAALAYQDASNDDVPNLSPSNVSIGISGVVTEDGTEVMLDQTQANVLNGQGIVTAINVNGWRIWGNNSACYPSTTDPKERWFNIRRFFTWWGNSFILTYFQKVDDPANYRLIESIVDSENIRGNAYVSQGKCAGIRVEYLESENPITDILDGKVQFHIYLAPYTPAEDIVATLEFDPDMLEAALSGGES
ncbi:MAG: phage tail sheath family protein [Clostridia bacterium]|nr:phage tail sheath family protein [Clostridia bacterium]